MVDLISGQVALAFDQITSSQPQVEMGKLRALAHHECTTIPIRARAARRRRRAFQVTSPFPGTDSLCLRARRMTSLFVSRNRLRVRCNRPTSRNASSRTASTRGVHTGTVRSAYQVRAREVGKSRRRGRHQAALNGR